MAKIDCWTDKDFHGDYLGLSNSASDLSVFGRSFGGNWNDEITSFKVISGVWRLFEDTNYGGLPTQEFHPGTAINNCPDAGFPNKWVSSIQKIKD